MKRYLIATYIDEYIRSHGYAPTYRELAHVFGVCEQVIGSHIRALVNEGVIVRQRYKTRGITMNKDAA